MNIKKRLSLNGTQVEKATQILRAYKHPFRYRIIDLLLDHGELTICELASFLQMEESYVAEQLDILNENGLVLTEFSENGLLYSANETFLIKTRDGVRNLA